MDREDWKRLAEERPRLYGAALLALGSASLLLMRVMAHAIGRASILLTVLAPLLIVFGVQALVLGASPSTLRNDRTSLGVLLVISALGAILAVRWVTG